MGGKHWILQAFPFAFKTIAESIQGEIPSIHDRGAA